MTELTQSRNATASEALTIMRSQGAVFRRRLGAVRHFRLARIAWLAALLGLSAVFLFACDMGWIPPVSLWVEVPVIFIVAFGLCRLWTVYYSGVCAELYRECLPGNRRLRLEADGIVISGPAAVSSIPWSAIRDIVASKEWLMIYLSPVQTISFPKAAFEGQDVEGFGAELVRRWQAQRAPAGAAA